MTFTGKIDKLMTPEQAFDMLCAKSERKYLLGEFPLRDALQFATSISWEGNFYEAVDLIFSVIETIMMLDDSNVKAPYVLGIEKNEFRNRSHIAVEDIQKDIEFCNTLLDRMCIPYHFYGYETITGQFISIKRDGGIV